MNEIIRTGAPLPVVAAVNAGNGNTVTVTWADGHTVNIDLTPVLFRYRMLKPLHDNRALFESVRVGYRGSSIEWANDIDIGADTLERLERQQRIMTTDEFRAWMKRNTLTLDIAAAVLGISRRLAADLSAGNRPMDLNMTLACEGYDARSATNAAE